MVLRYSDASYRSRKMIKVPPQIMTSYDRIANERPVYIVIDQSVEGLYSSSRLGVEM